MGFLRRAVDKYEAPIDLKRPVVKNPDGSISTERTLTFGDPSSGYSVVPSLVDGIQRTPEQAFEMMRSGQNSPVGVFPGLPEAEAYARWRSGQIGRVR